MSGALLAAASGVGFGLFQSVNVRALRDSDDPFASTVVQVGVSAVVLVLACLVTGTLAEAEGVPLISLVDFGLAGLLHFFAGWSLLNLSQQRIGAARTSPLLTTVPLFGVVLAVVTLGQFPAAVSLVGIALMCAGAYVVTVRGGLESARGADAVPGLACAFLWALSPVFVLRGLEGFDSPLFGLTVGLVVSAALLGPAYVLWRGSARAWQSVTGSSGALKLLAGLLVAISTWWRWLALDNATVGAVLALSLLSVPVVLLVAPLMAGRDVERVTMGLWVGAGLVVSGALVLMVE